MKGIELPAAREEAANMTVDRGSVHGSKIRDARKHSFTAVYDSRNRRVPHLEIRNGRFHAQLWMDRGDGRKTARRFALVNESGEPARNIPEAKAAIEILRHGRREDTLPTMGRKPTVEEQAAIYLGSGVFAAKKPRTQDNERQAIKRWVAHAGAVRVDKIAAAHLADFIDRRLKGRTLGNRHRKARRAGERTVNLDLIAFRNLLNAAVDAGHLRTLLTFPRVKTPPPRKKPTVPPDGVEKLIAAIPAACKANAVQVVDFIRLLCYCGAREQEALRLKWDAVDFARRVLTIGADGDTKNRTSRTVEFNPALEAHLRDMRSRGAPDSEWLFPSPRRGESDRATRTFRESLNLARAEAKMPGFGFHDCRRFFATMAIQAMVDVQTVARWLGHKDGGILVAKTYSDVLGDHRRRMADNLSFAPGQERSTAEGNA